MIGSFAKIVMSLDVSSLRLRRNCGDQTGKPSAAKNSIFPLLFLPIMCALASPKQFYGVPSPSLASSFSLLRSLINVKNKQNFYPHEKTRSILSFCFFSFVFSTWRRKREAIFFSVSRARSNRNRIFCVFIWVPKISRKKTITLVF